MGILPGDSLFEDTEDILEEEYVLITMKIIVVPSDEDYVKNQFYSHLITNSDTDYGIISHEYTSQKTKMIIKDKEKKT